MDTTQLTVTARAVIALGTSEREASLLALAKKHVGITAITNEAGRADCHSAYMELKSERVDLEKRGKAARDDAQAFAKAVIGEEKRLVGIIGPEEDRLKALRDGYDAELERQRLAIAEVESKRVAGHLSTIQRIKDVPAHAVGKTSKAIEELIESVRVTEIGAAFEEFRVEAEDAQRTTLAQLSVMLTGVKAQEDKEAEFERLKKAEAERLAVEAAARAQAEEESRAAAAADEKRRREALDEEERHLAQERAAQAKELAEARARQEAEFAAERAEQERLDTEARAVRETEEKRLADLAEELAFKEREATDRRRAEDAERARIVAENDAYAEANPKIVRGAPIFLKALLELRAIVRPGSPESLIIEGAFVDADIIPVEAAA